MWGGSPGVGVEVSRGLASGPGSRPEARFKDQMLNNTGNNTVIFIINQR